MAMRFRKLFPRDIKSSIVQADLNKYTRVGVVRGVDTEKGTCTIEWCDKPGMRVDVLITQANSKDWDIPEKGSYVLVSFDHKDQARIVRYINMGHESRVKVLKTLPKFKEGEKFFEVGGAYLWIKKNGNIIMSTHSESYLLLENSSGTLKSETVNWKILTDAGMLYFGVIKRFKSGSDGSKTQEMVEDIQGNILTELKIKVVETSDNQVGVSGLTNPLMEITLGTLVNDDGGVVCKNDAVNIYGNEKDVCLRIKLQSGVKIDIDKEGRMSLEGVKLNINNGEVDSTDPDVVRSLETASSKGTKGQHAAREHDKIVIPIGAVVDTEHTGIASKGITNLTTLQTLLASCTPTVILPTSMVSFEGEIVEGSENVIIGD
jgi:hypothetical protein